MKVFNEYINEMAFISGSHDNKSFNLKSDWDEHYKKEAKVLHAKLPKQYKIYYILDYNNKVI